jgi:HEAT repeat protein
MKYSKTFLCVATNLVLLILASGSANAITIDEAIEKLKTHKFGQNSEVLNFLYESAVRSHSDRALREKLNKGLVSVLESDAGYDAKQFACRQLALTATDEHIPVLGRHLTDDKMSHMALYVLTHIDSPEVDKALLAALDKATGPAELGIINMLGNRQCSAAIKPLGKLMVSADEGIAIEAIKALGRIGTKAAHSQLALYNGLKEPSEHEALALEYARLDCADGLLAHGQSELALRSYRFAFETYSSGTLRAAALKGLASADSEEAIPLVAESLDHSDRTLRQMAVQLAQEIPGKQATQMLAERLPSLEPEAQATLLHALAVRGDATALAAVRNSCNSDEVSVRVAALEATGMLGDASTVKSLAEHAAKARGAELEAARAALQALRGADINPTMVKQLKSTDEKAKVELIAALAARDAVETTQAILDTAGNGTSPVRIASFKALRTLTEAHDIAALFDLLVSAEEDVRDEAAKTVASVARRFSIAESATAIGLEKLRATQDKGARASMLMLLGGLGDGRALPVLRSALAGPDNRIRDAAVRGLSQWPAADSNGEPMGDLLEIAQTSDSKVHRVLALRGYINLITTANNLSASQKADACKTAMKLADGPSEKRRVLAKTAELGSIEALGVAQAYLDDENLKAEAAAAAATIAETAYNQDLKATRAAMQRVLSIDVPAFVQEKARKIVKDIDSIKAYLSDWQVSGPYMQQGKNCSQLFDIPFGPELPDVEVRWKPMPISAMGPHPAYLDLLKELNGGEQRVAYLRTKIDSDAERTVRLEIFSDDGVKAWLNGSLVHANNCLRPIPANPDTADVTLKKGVNHLMLKVTQNNMPWGAIVRLRETEQ